jgi:hypothetical protein
MVQIFSLFIALQTLHWQVAAIYIGTFPCSALPRMKACVDAQQLPQKALLPSALPAGQWIMFASRAALPRRLQILRAWNP